jgi:hypothetical protein
MRRLHKRKAAKEKLQEKHLYGPFDHMSQPALPCHFKTKPT